MVSAVFHSPLDASSMNPSTAPMTVAVRGPTARVMPNDARQGPVGSRGAAGR